MRDKFQTNLKIIRLYDSNIPESEVTKVGILAFTASPEPGKWQFKVMKPSDDKKKHSEPSPFQIPKGTRRILENGQWRDMREEDVLHADPSTFEPLVTTALREGHEEIGLRGSNIKDIFDMGNFVFTSASKGVEKPLHMFAVRIGNKNSFDTPESTTSEERWLTQGEFEKRGRSDHVSIMKGIAEHLNTYYGVRRR
jgi:hypothetical protein